MEGIAPTLGCILELQSALHNGESVRNGLLRYLRGPSDDLQPVLRRFLFAWDQGQEWRALLPTLKSPYRRALIELISSALAGQSIQSPLQELYREIEMACELEIKSFVEMLPLKMLIPLLLFQFPAFVLLLFGPLLTRFVTELNR